MLYVIITLVVPAGIVALAAWDDLHARALYRDGETVSATVTAREQKSDGDGGYDTVVRFRYPVGEWAEPMTGSCALPKRAHPNAYAVGDRIEVIYQRRRPTRVTLSGVPRRSNTPAALVIAGMILAIMLAARAMT